MSDGERIVAVDIGNSRIAWQCFAENGLAASPVVSTDGKPQLELPDTVTGWIGAGQADWVLGSVHDGYCAAVQSAIRTARPADSLRVLCHEDLPLEILVRFPGRAGMDRLLAAVAANARRSTDSPAIVVDSGSAITVDAIDQQGRFLGGAILPGVQMAARSLAQFTDKLPLVEPPQQAPDAIGKDTDSAIASGLFWGSLGAIRQLGESYAQAFRAKPQWFLTGGSTVWRDLFPEETHCSDNLVLEGLAIAARAGRT